MNKFNKKNFLLYIFITFISFLIVACTSSSYERKTFGSWKRNLNKNGLNTRHDVLQEESLIPVTYKLIGKYKKRKQIISGKWKDLYTGEVYYLANKLEIDHVVSVKEAWLSGACKWSEKKKRTFYNDLKNPHHLIAIASKTNRSKGDLDIVYWLPTQENFVKEYLKMWVSVKRKWKLFIDKKEQQVLTKYLKTEDFQDLKIDNNPCK